MRGFEMNGDVPISQHPIREPEMQVQPSAVMQSIQERRMQLMTLFQRKVLVIARPNPLGLSQRPDEMKPRFDVGNGGRK